MCNVHRVSISFGCVQCASNGACLEHMILLRAADKFSTIKSPDGITLITVRNYFGSQHPNQSLLLLLSIPTHKAERMSCINAVAVGAGCNGSFAADQSKYHLSEDGKRVVVRLLGCLRNVPPFHAGGVYKRGMIKHCWFAVSTESADPYREGIATDCSLFGATSSHLA